MTPATFPREVPLHDTAVFGPKHHRYALVIPVINEGERIRDQLRRIAKLAPAIDVIIADGGSVDGSLDPDFLREVGTRALLTKRGPGKLSAQLRMAYAWCLDEGYDGVLTMDGNGKDGVDAIPRFTKKLDQGYGYVQGSRYCRGGEAVNTPWDRKLAGRLIHAPLMSLAGRRLYTDTTNGFRAYSSVFLSDSRVAPLRNVFTTYTLLFYLTIRAGQLGYRTTEIPVSRRYPPSGKTPTKIAGFRGRLDMMGEIWDVIRGRYNPDSR